MTASSEFISDEEQAEWEEAATNGRWHPRPGDALHDCAFAKVGFRSYGLADPDGRWRIVLSRVDLAEREPHGLVTVYAPGHDAAFGDLDGEVTHRSIGLFGGTNMRGLVEGLARRLGGNAEDWNRRVDYLTARTRRELQRSAPGRTFAGKIERPAGVPRVFTDRLAERRTLSLFGPASAGKTTLAEGLLVSCSTGIEVVPGWRPQRRYTCGLLDWDEGEEEEQARLYAILYGIGLDALPTPYHYLPMSRPLTDAADEVGRWVMDNGVEVLFVSPANRALRPASGDPGAPVFDLYEVLREFSTTNLLIDHVSGVNIDNPAASREYGSVAKRDAARSAYSVFVQSEEPGERVVVLRNTKPDALTPRRPAQAVRITFSPAWPGPDGVYDAITFSGAEVTSAPTEAREPQHERLVRTLREHGPLTTEQVCTVTGLEAGRLKYIARRARDVGYHVHQAKGAWVLSMPKEEQ